MLDDWTGGVGKSPQQILADLKAQGMGSMGPMDGSGGMGTMDEPAAGSPLGADPGDVSYPYYVINGRIPAAPTSFAAKPGRRIRVRLVNSGSDTAFRVALGGHRMTLTHTEGFPVVPTEVDALLIGMGERYDVIVTAGGGVFPLVGVAEGKNDLARALLSTGAGSAPPAGFQPPELNGKLGTIDMFTATPGAQLNFNPSDGATDIELQAELMMKPKHVWASTAPTQTTRRSPSNRASRRR